MNRPFYVHTPKNHRGESLIHPANNVVYSIRNCMDANHSDVKQMGKDLNEAQNEVKSLNDLFEGEMAAMHI